MKSMKESNNRLLSFLLQKSYLIFILKYRQLFLYKKGQRMTKETENNLIEEWRDIAGYEGLYQVSNLGNVRSLDRYINTSNGKTYHRKENYLSQAIRNNYKSVSLSLNNEMKAFLVHRLVGQAFIPNPENKPQIDHIDGNKLNNIYTNLRWTTAEENCNNPLRIEKFLGENNHYYGKHHSEEIRVKMSGPRECIQGGNNPAARAVLHGATGETFETVLIAAKAFGVCETTMRNILQGKTNYKNDGTWRYIDGNK